MRGSGSASARSSKAWPDRADSRAPAARADHAPPIAGTAGTRRKGMALVEGFRGDVLVWLRLDGDGRSRAAICATRPGSSGRCWRRHRRQHRRRLPALQQIVQLLLFRARSLRRCHAKHAVRRPAPTRPLTEPPPRADDAALAELAAQLDRAARRRLGRSLSIREVDAGSCNGCELEIHALNNAFYDLERSACASSPRRATPTCCW